MTGTASILVSNESVLQRKGNQYNSSVLGITPMIEFSPHYTEGPHKFTLRHGYLSMSFSDNLHVAAPILDHLLSYKSMIL